MSLFHTDTWYPNDIKGLGQVMIHGFGVDTSCLKMKIKFLSGAKLRNGVH